MKLNSEALDELEEIRAVNLESDLIRMLSERLSIRVDDAMRLYYESGFSEQLAENENGEQFLDSAYLFDELIRRLNC